MAHMKALYLQLAIQWKLIAEEIRLGPN